MKKPFLRENSVFLENKKKYPVAADNQPFLNFRLNFKIGSKTHPNQENVLVLSALKNRS